MTHPTPDDFDQLRGAFDDPVAPAPSFAARLREEIAMEVTKTVAPADIRRTVEPLRAARQAESVPLTSWHGALATAAVIALVLALGFVTIREAIAPERGDDQALVPADPTASGSLFGQTSASATPGAIAGPDLTPSAGFAGADASWPISGVADELGDEIVEVPFVFNSETELTPNLGVVGTTGFTYGDAGLVAFDMTSNTILWTWAGTVPQRLVSDGQIVTFYSQNVPTAEFGLFGLDIATGEQRWLSTDPSSVGDDSSNNGPIIVDGVVYAGFDERIIRAIDAVTGETRWETSLDHEFGSRSFSPNPDGSPATRSFDLHIALVDAELYVFSGGRFLDVLSPGNGVVIRSAESLPELATDAYDWRVFSVVDGVGYVSATQTRIVSYATPINGAFSGDVDEGHLYALDLTSLGVRWEIDLEDESGTVIDVGGPVVAVGSTFQRIDAATGNLTELADVGSGGPASTRGDSIQRTTGERAWFVMELDEGFTVVELDASGMTHTWSHGLEGAPIYADIVADPDGSLRIVTSYSSTYVIPAANAVPESGYEFDEADSAFATPDAVADSCEPSGSGTTPEATPAGEPDSSNVCIAPISAVDPTTPLPDEGMYATNATPEGRDSEGAEGEVPGSTRTQPTPTATIGDSIIQPLDPSPTPSTTGTPSSGFTGVDAAWTIDGVAPELGDTIAPISGVGEGQFAPTRGIAGDIGLFGMPNNSGLLAFDLASGVEIWRVEGSIGTNVANDGSTVVFPIDAGARSGRIGFVALDITSGSERWFLDVPSLSSQDLYGSEVLIVDGVVYAATEGRTIHAIELGNGVRRWNVTLSHTWQDAAVVVATIGDMSREFRVSMAVVDDRLVVLSGVQFLDALSVEDGTIVASADLAGSAPNDIVRSSLGIVGDAAYVTLSVVEAGDPSESQVYLASANLVAVDLATFTIRWSVPVNEFVSPVMSLGGVPVMSAGADLLRFDPATGESARLENPIPVTSNGANGFLAGDGEHVWLTRSIQGRVDVFQIGPDGVEEWWWVTPALPDMPPGIIRIEADADGALLLFAFDTVYRIAPASKPMPIASPVDAFPILPNEPDASPEA
jgi:outer membrane protein assembly factor BamB